MEAKTKKRLIVVGVIIAVIALLVLLAFVLPGSKDTVANFGVSGRFMDESYQSYLEDHNYDSSKAGPATPVEVDIANFTADPEAGAALDSQGVTIGERGDITWNFDVAQAGFYNIKFKYYSLEGTNATPQRSVQIDGETLFDGMKQISFQRAWLNNDGEIAN